MTPTPYFSPRLTIILATYNESLNIVEMIDRVLAHAPGPVEIVVVDDDSPDRTWELVENYPDPRVRLVHRKGVRGLASAYVRGIMESRGELIGWMDADLGMPAERLPAMVDALKEADIVVGSRYVDGGKDNRPAFRVAASVFVNRFARAVLGGNIKDYDSGFLVMRRSVLDHLMIVPRGYGEYFIELLFVAQKKGLRVVEIGYEFTDRIRGESKSAPNAWSFAITGTQYLRKIVDIRFRKYD